MKSITAADFDRWARGFLDIAGYEEADRSLNGIQIEGDGRPVRKAAFAVDASLEAAKQAAQAGAQILFVHHGLFWGQPLRIAGNHRKRVKAFLDAGLALYACHLPLDQQPEIGNNATMARLLGLVDLVPLCKIRGMDIGFRGKLSKPLTIAEAAKAVSYGDRRPLALLPFGKEKNETAALISGGGAPEAKEAIKAGCDLYVTGETNHSLYHEALEAGLNIAACGHYATEVWGVKNVQEKCEKELMIDTVFLDIPTGL